MVSLAFFSQVDYFRSFQSYGSSRSFHSVSSLDQNRILKFLLMFSQIKNSGTDQVRLVVFVTYS